MIYFAWLYKITLIGQRLKQVQLFKKGRKTFRLQDDGHLPVSDNGNDLLNSLEKFDNLFREQLDKIKNINKGNKPPLIHVLGDFNFRDIVWPDRLSKSGSSLSQTEGQILIDIMNDHGLEQLVNFPTRERNTLDLILTSLPGQFADIHSPDKLSDHDIVSGTLKIAIPPIKKPRRKVYRYQKGDYESMRAETLKFAKERYFNGYSDTRSVQENFNLITSFIQESADKHIPSKTSRSVSSVPWITPEIRRFAEKMQLMQKLKRLVVQNLDLNLNLYGKRSKLISGSSMIFT